MTLNLISLLPLPIGLFFMAAGGFPGLLLGGLLCGLGLTNLSEMKGRNLND